MEKPHKKLRGWQLGMDIAVDVYKTTESFPVEEKYGLISQMRRSAVSVPSNIAEVRLDVKLLQTCDTVLHSRLPR